jgi:S-DNA-T family DNA segregation ATPase FtsK/SpoIIIE
MSAFGGVVATVAAQGVLPLAGAGGLTTLATAGGLAYVASSAAAGMRSDRRAALRDLLTEALYRLMELPAPSRRRVKCWRWRGGFVGRPHRIRLEYGPMASDDNPLWLQEVLDKVSSRLGGQYRLHHQDSSRCQLILALDTDAAVDPEEGPDSEVFERADRILHELLGESLTVVPTWVDSAHPLAADLIAAPAPTSGGDDLVTLRENAPVKGSPQHLIALEVEHNAGARVASLAVRTRIQRTVSTLLPGRWRALWDLENEVVRFEVRPRMPENVANPPFVPQEADHRNWREVRLPWGVDENGETLYWRPALEPHMVVTGTTGGGKTVLLDGIILQICANNWPCVLIDGKGTEFLGFATWPNVQLVATETAEHVAVLHHVRRLVEERRQMVKRGQMQEADFTPLFLVIDEYADIRDEVTRWYQTVKGKGDPAKAPMLLMLASIARIARSFKIHIVLGLQRPDVEFLTGEMRDNMRARVAMGRLSPDGSKMMFDSYSAGVSVPKIPGRATCMDGDNRIREAQVWWTPDPRRTDPDNTRDIEILRGLLPTQRHHERLVVVPPAPQNVDGVIVPASYREWADAPIVPVSQRPDLDVDVIDYTGRLFTQADAIHAQHADVDVADSIVIYDGHSNHLNDSDWGVAVGPAGTSVHATQAGAAPSPASPSEPIHLNGFGVPITGRWSDESLLEGTVDYEDLQGPWANAQLDPDEVSEMVVPAAEVREGDLVQFEGAEWVIVDAVEDDPMDPDSAYRVLSWRALDDSETGMHSCEGSERITVQRVISGLDES